MSWFTIYSGDVIFGALQLCNASIDWQFFCNIGGPYGGPPTYCRTFPDSTCNFSPSEVFSSFNCESNTSTPQGVTNGCPGNSIEKFYVDYKFRQEFMGSPHVNVSVIATIECDQVVMENNGTGLLVSIQDNTSQAGCPGYTSTSTSGTLSSTTTTESNLSTSASTLTSTFLTTKTYTITSCPPTVTGCPLGSLTTETITSYTTFCPASVSTTPLLPSTLISSSSESSPKSTLSSSTQSISLSIYSSPLTSSSSATKLGSTSTSSKSTESSNAPTSTLSPLQVSSGSFIAIPAIFGWYSALLPILSIPSVLGSVKSNHGRRDNFNLLLLKRIPVADFADIKSFGTTLSSTMESNLPTTPSQTPTLLQGRISLVTTNMCQTGKTNLNKYGLNWTATPKVLSQMLADCATSMDQMDQDLLTFYTQDEINAGPQGVLFLKFAGIMYCNRLIAALVDDAASLDGICAL